MAEGPSGRLVSSSWSIPQTLTVPYSIGAPTRLPHSVPSSNAPSILCISVSINIGLVAGSAKFDVQSLLQDLGPPRWMLHFYPLLARLEARNDLSHPSFERTPYPIREHAYGQSGATRISIPSRPLD